MKKYILGLSVLFAVVVMAFAACSKSSSGSNPEPAPPATPPAASVSVEIKNFAFSASSVSIKKGGTVTWTNADSTPHTVTDNAGTFDSNSMATSATYSRKFETAGTYTYHCNFHSSMTGTVVVSN